MGSSLKCWHLAKSFAWPVGAVLFAALVLLGLVRPALKGGAERPPGHSDGGRHGGCHGAAEQPERPALPAPTKKDELLPATPEQLRLEDARLLAKEEPHGRGQYFENLGERRTRLIPDLNDKILMDEQASTTPPSC